MARKRVFEHSFYEFEDITNEDTPEGRYYVVPSGERYRSVTTRIGDYLGTEHLDRWIKRVGKEEADKISTQAANRGTAVHAVCEAYVRNSERFPDGVMPSTISTFKTIRPILDKNIGRVFGIEAPLFSHTLRTAGRSDLIAEWQGTPAIIDYKTSRRLKNPEWIEKYEIQTACYAMMVGERVGVDIPISVIIIAVDEEDEPQVFVRERAALESRVREVFA